MRRKRVADRSCYYSHQANTKKAWQLSGHNPWRLGQKEALQNYRMNRSGAGQATTWVESNEARQKQFKSFFADFFTQGAQYQMNGSPHFIDCDFPTGEEDRAQFLEHYYTKYFKLKPPSPRRRSPSISKSQLAQNRQQKSPVGDGAETESCPSPFKITGGRLSPGSKVSSPGIRKSRQNLTATVDAIRKRKYFSNVRKQ